MLSECVKATVLLVCSLCVVYRFFFFFSVIDLCSFFYSIFTRFIQRFSLFIYTSILVSHFVFFSFFFFCLLFVPFFSFYIYHSTSSVFALYIYSANLLSHFVFYLFIYLVLNSSYSTELVYLTLLSQNSLFHIQFFWVAFLYFFSLHTILSKNT